MVVLRRAVVDELARRPARGAADVNRAAGTLAIAPTNSGARVNGSETNVSELLRHEVVVKPTGSVTALVCARVTGLRNNADVISRERVMRRIEKICLGQG